MGDYYTDDLSRLGGQPKRSIGDYVESEGIKVPRRFDSLQEARLKGGAKVLLRSEHVDEYARIDQGRLVPGISGLLSSRNLSRFVSFDNLDSIRSANLADKEIGDSKRVMQYCEFTGVGIDEFIGGISYSLWELVGGVNRYVIADSAIPGRYHIGTLVHNDLFKPNYAMMQGEELVFSQGIPLPPDLEQSLPRLVRLYERVRNLPRFDPNNCPILEVQTVDDEDYFLQYHRTVDFAPASFTLASPGDAYAKALFARGATQQEGVVVDVELASPGLVSRQLPDEEAGTDLLAPLVYSELLASRRKVHLERSTTRRAELASTANGHRSRSAMFKPDLSLMYFEDDLLEPRDLYDARREGTSVRVPLHVISDGTNAYFRKV